MTESPLAAALHLLVRATDAVRDAVGSAGDADLIAAMTVCEGVVRRLDGVTVDAVAVVARRGAFAERGYTSPMRALSDLLGWEAFEARRRVVAAEQLTSRIGMDGVVLPARLPATAAMFTDGRASLRHVEVDRPPARHRRRGPALARAVGRRGGTTCNEGRPVHPDRAAQLG